MRRPAAHVVMFACALGCAEPAPPPACPPPTWRDDARAERVVARLRTADLGVALFDAAGAGVRQVCFAPRGARSVIDDGHSVFLSEELEEGEAAARYGHLLVHLRDGLPDAELHGPDCEAAVERALAREATAYVAEVTLQADLGARPESLAFDFARQVLDEAPARRELVVLTYLRRHPDGAPGIDGLATAYRARCVAGR